MSQPRLLSGEEIVAKGATKAIVSLPEVGLKEVTPNGSWLEQKQIQSALDARKQLIEAERIEKWGTLSHAVWREELMLAEVTKKIGRYWQFLGHQRDKVLYLKPEEALYLMEVNCLHLKYNEVTVSLQQAYTLLLRDQISIMQYKVYASLSRLGYKVFRFSEPKTLDIVEKQVKTSVVDDKKAEQDNLTETEVTPTVKEDNPTVMEVDEKIAQNIFDENTNVEIVCDSKQESETKSNENKNNVESENAGFVDDKIDENMTNNNETDTKKTNVEENATNRTADGIETFVKEEETSANLNNSSIKVDEAMDIERPVDITEATDKSTYNVTVKDLNKNHKAMIYSRRSLRSHSTKDIHKFFDNIPDLLHKHSVTIVVPKQHLPEQVNPMYASYEINLNTVRTRKVNSPQPETVNGSINTATTTTTYNTNERRTEYRFESTFSSHPGQNNYFYTNVRFHRPPVFNQFQFWRPPTPWNTFPYNVFIQRPFIRNTFSRFHFFPRQPTPAYVRPDIQATPNPAYVRQNNNINETPSSSTSSRKRTRNSEQTLRFDTIKNLAMKLKNRRTTQYDNNMGLVTFIENLIQIYNGRYRPTIYLTDTFDIEENEIIVDTITLDDDEVVSKKRRVAENNMFEENFCKVQQLASKLKDLESKGLATARHRRALSSVVKTFNKSFNADIYVNESYQVVDRRQIVLDSSSESDCVVKESEVKKERKKGGKRKKTGKKVRNPFNLLKTLAEKNRQGTSSRKDSEIEEISSEDSVVVLNKDSGPYCEEMKRNFKSWLPRSDDFGRAEIVPKSLMISRIVEANKLAFLYDFIKHQTCKFRNWLDVKISFLENMEYAAALFNDHVMEGSSDWDSIIKPEDCKDMPSVLSKLSIIPNKKDTSEETSLKLDFDVYNRDVQNFKKRNVPKPHFRIICVKQCSGLPPGPDVIALHNRYNDVPIVFAVVGESVSYLQINPINTPVYIPEGETV